MGLPDGLGGVKSGLVEYGIPLVGGLVGVALGGTDVLGVNKFLTETIPVGLGKTGVTILSAAGFAILGTMLWGRFGVIGKFAGAFCWGYALGSLYVAATGKAIKIPGFGEAS